jgi:TetR/AcrR family transcriptional repressor of mexJK operon
MAQDQKRHAIIEAAQKRFAHFGVGKTTMNELADDLSISKASLYYYFPDKLNLYAAVLQTIIENDEANDEEFLNEKDPLKAITIYLEVRTRFIIKYYNILEYLRTLKLNVPKELEPVFSRARSREVKIVTTILENTKKFKPPAAGNTQYIAELFLDGIEGLRFSAISQKNNFFPDKKQFGDLLNREKEFAAIFLKGLAC